jgi:hypothetical protein
VVLRALRLGPAGAESVVEELLRSRLLKR